MLSLTTPPDLIRRRSASVLGALCLVVGAGACGAGETDDEKAGAGGPGSADAAVTYHSRPDLTPPTTTLETYADYQPIEGSYVFVATKGDDVPHTGGLILDEAAEPVWVAPTEKSIFDLRVQEYQGEPVLTYWRGEPGQGHGNGEIVLLDTSYSEIATVTTGGDLEPGNVDIHESTITADDTALLISYVPTEADLSEFGGDADGWVFDSVIQEVDIASGEVLFEWHSLEHVDVTESVAELDIDEDDGTADSPFSYFHLNSINLDTDGNLLISSRNTSAIYKLDRESGEVLWKLGGEDSDFDMGEGTTFHWQHDAQRQADGTITLFDNEAEPAIGDSARGLRLAVDETAMTVELVTEYLPPDGDRTSGSQGSFQQLPDGTVLIGWGSQAWYSEYAADGTPLTNVALGPGHSYRAYRAIWSATPTEPPAAVHVDDSVFVSWNGATEVAGWRLVVDGQVQDVVPRGGFETELPIPTGIGGELVVEALDDGGQVLESVEVSE